MAARITAPRGTNDVLPPASAAWNRFEAEARAVAEVAGYGEIRTPMFEATELFVRGVGETTDIVEKEMYTFTDKGGRSMTLRPEWTAPVVRAVLEHQRLAQGPQRLYYLGPFFRYERPQAGRYRQANQFGVECFGFEGPEADAEVIALAAAMIARYRLAVTLRLNTVGDERCRPAYREALLAHFRPLAASLSADSQRRLERNPLRILDSKAPEDQAAIDAAPAQLDHLCDACAAHFAALRAALDAAGIPYAVDPRLVRGFDYYTRTVFEFSSTALGAQSAVCGGGRYDGLVAALGGPPTPGVGFGMGIERFLMVVAAAGAPADAERRGFQAVALGERARARLLPLVLVLRGEGVAAFADWRERKLAAQFKTADANGARFALVLGDDELAAGEIVLRDLLGRVDHRLALPADPHAAAGLIVARAAALAEPAAVA